MRMSEAVWYHVGTNQQPVGPMTLEALGEALRIGGLPAGTLVWREGWADWTAASAVPELRGLAAAAPPAPSTPLAPPVQAGPVVAPRSPWAIPPMPPAGYAPRAFGRIYAWWWVCVILGVLLAVPGFAAFIMGAVMEDEGNPDGAAIAMVGLLVCLVGCLPASGAWVLGCVQIYRWWRQIQDGFATTGPGKAVGFLFIPLFNMYWQFVAYWNLAKDLRSFMDRNAIAGPRPAPALAMTVCIASCCAAVPYAGCLVYPVFIVLFLVMFHQLHAASAAIARHLSPEPAA